MNEPRFHRQEASNVEKLVFDWLLFLGFCAALIFSFYAGTWPVVLAWLALNWTTIWQIGVLWLLVSLVSKR